MCALRDSRSIPAISLACQYRLNVTPKRPTPRKVLRRRKDGQTAEVKSKEKKVDLNERRVSTQESEEEDYDFDADDDYDLPVDDTELSQKCYLRACKELDIPSIRTIYLGLVKETLSCKGLVLQPYDIKACTIALVGNSNCETIEFEGNEIGQKPSVHFGDVFSRNAYITEIIIRWNAIGSLGAEAICGALLKNHNVKLLDLTGNQFKEEDARYFKELLSENSSVHELYLGHNFFREEGGQEIADGLAQNDFVRVLDLSWNHLRLKGAIAIGEALEKNTNLEVLDLSWNGLYIQGAGRIGLALTKNQTLKDLDLSCNRLSEVCLGEFLKGLSKNTTLQKLRIGRNHITPTGAVVILEFIKSNPSIAVDFIDFGDQHVQDDFVNVLTELQASRSLEVKYGMVWSRERDPLGKQDQSEDELALLNENPHYVLMEFMRIQKLRLVDLFHQMDKDNSKGISVSEFQTGLQAVDIPLKVKTLERFVKACDTDKNGEIDYSELIEANRKYKAEIRSLAQKNIPIETTDIGRIQKLLRKIMLNTRGVPRTEDSALIDEPGEKSLAVDQSQRRKSSFNII